MHTVWAILIIAGLLTVIVATHELGHALPARWFGVGVEVFSIGFGRGPTLFTTAGGTRVKLGWFPVGGYVRLARPETSEEIDANYGMIGQTGKLGLTAIILGGPAVNIVVGLIALTMIGGFSRATELFVDDIVSIPVALYNTVVNPGSDMTFSGPIGMVQIFSELSLSWHAVFVFFAIINIGLGTANLLPDPVLDGGRWVFGMIEQVRGRRFGPTGQKIILATGVSAVATLFIFTTGSDIIRLVTG